MIKVKVNRSYKTIGVPKHKGRRIRLKEDLDLSIKEIDTKRRRLMIE
jgi:hypothetical protein